MDPSVPVLRTILHTVLPKKNTSSLEGKKGRCLSPFFRNGRKDLTTPPASKI
jgi:hypothetical protein